jgi:hypothetical protein
LSSHPRWRKRRQRRTIERETEKGRQRVRGRENCHPNRFPRVGIPSLGHHPKRIPNRLARHSHAKQRGTPTSVGGIPGTTL